MAAFLSVRSLTFGYGDRPILHNISFEAQQGAVTMIVGASGCGKSTLLRLINRLIEPPAGAIWLDGEDVTNLPPKTLRRRAGLVFQRPRLFQGTVAENIRYGPNLTGHKLSDTEMGDLLEAVQLDADMGKVSAETLSGGQIQRVAIARILANEPHLLLLDEATTALDPRATHHVEETVRHLCATRQLAALWVTHDVAQVSRVADHIIYLQDGKVMACGTAAQLEQHTAFRAFAAGASG